MRKAITFHMDEELWKNFKSTSALSKYTMTEVLTMLVKGYIEYERGKSDKTDNGKEDGKEDGK